jgi:ubiquinone/menaquinone biosynthesis C-methylase UbiE
MRTREEYKDYYNIFYKGQDFRHYPDSVNRAFISGLGKSLAFPPRPRILDLGCGTGVQMQAMRALAYRPTGLDISICGLRCAQRTCSGIPLVNGDAFHLPFPDAVFDVVISFGSILNYDRTGSITEIMEESNRVVVSGGWVILTTLSDYSGSVKGGWKQRGRGELAEILHAVIAGQYRMIETFPKLARLFGAFAFHPIPGFCVKMLTGGSRTIILAFQKL